MTTLAETIRPSHRVALTIVAVLMMNLSTIDSSIAVVALPQIKAGLGATPDQIGWILTGYMVAAAIATPLAGALAERLGFRTVYIFGVIGFGLSSMLCGLATSLPQLVLFRILQGATGAVFHPLTQALLYDINPPERHGKAMSWFSVGAMTGPVIGPLLGGVITEYSNWRWIFFVNLPIVAVALVGVLVFMPKMSQDRSRRFDFLGFGFLALAIATVQLGLDRGESLDWLASNEILIEFALFALGMYLYAVHTQTTKDPFVNPKIFANSNFVAGVMVSFFATFMVFVPTTFTAIFLQQIQGRSVLDTGLIQTPRAVMMVLGMLLLGQIINNAPKRLIMGFGVVATAISLYGLSGLMVDSPVSLHVWTGILLAAGICMIFLPLNLLTFGTLEPSLRPMAMSIYSLTRQLGGSIGIAIMMSYMSRSTNDNQVRMVSGLTPYSDMFSLGQAGGWSIGDPTSFKLLTLEVNRQATVIALDNIFATMVWVALAALPFILLLRPLPPLAPLIKPAEAPA